MKTFVIIFLGIQACLAYPKSSLLANNLQQELEVPFGDSSILSSPPIECFYKVLPGKIYSCSLTVNNPGGKNLSSIAGTHLPGKDDTFVTYVDGSTVKTPIFPSVLCRQFPNLKTVAMSFSDISSLSASDFEDCRKLEVIGLGGSNIELVPEGVFRNSPKLKSIYFNQCKIRIIDKNAFVGTSVGNLGLSFNNLTIIDPAWFIPIRRTLKDVRLNDNQFWLLDNAILGGSAPNLDTLYLSSPQLKSIGLRPFIGLDNLRVLNMRGSAIEALERDWFIDIPNLQELYLDDNSLKNLPAGVFQDVPNLTVLSLDYNGLTIIDIGSFGDAILSLNFLSIVGNQINAIDPRVITQADNLDNLFLDSNECIDESFTQVSANVNNVLEQLSVCTKNFKQN